MPHTLDMGFHIFTSGAQTDKSPASHRDPQTDRNKIRDPLHEACKETSGNLVDENSKNGRKRSRREKSCERTKHPNILFSGCYGSTKTLTIVKTRITNLPNLQSYFGAIRILEEVHCYISSE